MKALSYATALLLLLMAELDGFCTEISLKTTKSGRHCYQNSGSSPLIRGDRTRLFYVDDDSQSWIVLAETEKWINKATKRTPHSHLRKTITYSASSHKSPLLVLADTFRLLDASYDLGESFKNVEEGKSEAILKSKGFRRTQLLVVPNCKEYSVYYETFHSISETTKNMLREWHHFPKTTRISSSLDETIRKELKHNRRSVDEERFCTTVNIAPLHPHFQDSTRESKGAGGDENNDPKLREYKEKKDFARRSPYPTFIIEVRSSPLPAVEPTDSAIDSLESIRSDLESRIEAGGKGGEAETETQGNILGRLESSFSKTAAKHPTNDPPPKTKTIQSATDQAFDALKSPAQRVEGWFASEGDWGVERNFVVYEGAGDKHFFANVVAFLTESLDTFMKSSASEKSEEKELVIVLPGFLATSSLSLQKFAHSLECLLRGCGLATLENLTIRDFHPEAVDAEFRTPSSALAIRVTVPSTISGWLIS